MNALVPTNPLRIGNGLPGPGRPTVATPEIKQEILDRLSQGDFLTTMCQEIDMPSSRTVYAWRDQDPVFDADFTRARELGATAWIEEGVHVSRTTETGAVTTFRSDGTVEMRREDMLGHRRLKADTFFKAAAVICPSRFGAKVALTGGAPSDPVIKHAVDVAVTMAPRDASEAYIDSLREET